MNIFSHFILKIFKNRISPKAWNEKIRRDSMKVGVGITVTRPGSGLTEYEESQREKQEEQEEEEVVTRDCHLSVSQCQL